MLELSIKTFNIMLRSFQLITISLFILFSAIFVSAQNPVSWSLESAARGKSLAEGETFSAKLKANIEGDWHLYAVEQPEGGPFPTRITAADNTPFQIDGKVSSPSPITQFDPNFQIDTKFFAKQAEFNFPSAARSRRKITKPPRRSANNERQTIGALSLLTPCVFPMIPITVSYFTNHSAGNRAKAVKLAGVYSLGIIADFTILGMLLAIFVGAAGINLFAANPYINLLIAGIFLFFAFNLFGAYEITVPTAF
jgi:hypothetical protein